MTERNQRGEQAGGAALPQPQPPAHVGAPPVAAAPHPGAAPLAGEASPAGQAPPAGAAPLADRFGRPLTYLRVAVTDYCNLRCLYCMPAGGVRSLSHGDILRFEEIARLVRVAVSLGVRYVRLTGGEPLVRPDVVRLVAMLRAVAGLEEVSMTTNGTLLASLAPELAAAGLSRVNISLDTLRADRFAAITRRGQIRQVWSGIEAALAAGLAPVKLNVVVMRGINDDELADFARLTLDWPVHVRFIELMRLGETAGWGPGRFVSAAEMRRRLQADFPQLEEAPPVCSRGSGPVPGPSPHDGPAYAAQEGTREGRAPVGHGPARYWRLPGAWGTIGFISQVSEHACGQCNRLRLSATGVLRPCLLSPGGLDLRTPLRSGASDADLKELFLQAAAAKPEQQEMPQFTAAPQPAGAGQAGAGQAAPALPGMWQIGG